jgi:hypothetical protein
MYNSSELNRDKAYFIFESHAEREIKVKFAHITWDKTQKLNSALNIY